MAISYDLVDVLRDHPSTVPQLQAAAEIESLRAEVERLKANPVAIVLHLEAGADGYHLHTFEEHGSALDLVAALIHDDEPRYVRIAEVTHHPREPRP